MATNLTLTVQQVSEHVAELILTNPAPRVMFTSSKDYVTHVFGAVERPRFRMEQPYSPDDAWSLDVDPTGSLSANLPPCAQPITVDLDAFFERQLDELSRRLLGALPSGRYMIVRSLRTPEAKDTVLLGNELVPAKPNCRTLCDTRTYHAAIFGADAAAAPQMSGLLVGIALLSSTGQNNHDAIWLFDLHGTAAPAAQTAELSVVLPLDSSLVVDAMAPFRTSRPEEAREIRERWASERGPAFARWLAGESEAI